MNIPDREEETRGRTGTKGKERRQSESRRRTKTVCAEILKIQEQRRNNELTAVKPQRFSFQETAENH